MEEQPQPTPVADCVAALVTYERESGDGMLPVSIRLGRAQRGLLNAELRGRRGFTEIRSPNRGEDAEPMGTLHRLPVYVVDDRSLIEIVLEKEPEDE